MQNIFLKEQLQRTALVLHFLYFKILLFNVWTLKDVRCTFINRYLALVIFGPLPDAFRSWIWKFNWKMMSRIKRKNQMKRKFRGEKESKKPSWNLPLGTLFHRFYKVYLDTSYCLFDKGGTEVNILFYLNVVIH